ncbi:MAG: type 1 glutamine amidotransferase [Tannerella sp.]|jgi:GMP synthase-like glutamine amidotransferase|nr:type 1 glutamine amidotransferase [Tannerella sp.]
MTLNILLCNAFSGTLSEEIPSHASLFINLFDSVNSKLTYRIYDAYNNEFPQNLNSDQIYIIAGHNSSLYEEKAWIKNLFSFIRGAHAMKVPLVGINFGHLAIAHALGGKVASSEKGWGAGIRESQIVDPVARRYFSANQLTLHYLHYNQVTQLPRGAVRFATSDFCKNEGFTLNSHILSFQGHPEYTDSTTRYLIQNQTDESREIKEKALNSIQQYESTTIGQKAVQWILDLRKATKPKSVPDKRYKFSSF